MSRASTLRDHSCLVNCCSHHAVEVSNEYGNGHFKCTFNNVNKLTHAIKVLPHTISLPHIFPNINQYNSSIRIRFQNADPEFVDWQIPHGFYTAEKLVELINNKFIEEFNTRDPLTDDFLGPFFINPETNMINLKNVKPFGRSCNILGQLEFFQMLGLHEFARENNTGVTADPAYPYKIQWMSDQLSIFKARGDYQLPNFGGEKLVHIIVRGGAAQGNMVAGSSQEHNVLATVPLHDVEYGQYIHSKAVDLYVDDIDYQSITNLQTIELQVVDHRFRPLPIPTNYVVSANLKVYHKDTHS